MLAGTAGVVGGLIGQPVGGQVSGTPVAVIGGLIAGTALTSLVGLSVTASGWFAGARLILALRGRLPWRLNAFLEDAYRRGVIRQAGAFYQFRHARLEDHLLLQHVRQVPRQ